MARGSPAFDSLIEKVGDEAAYANSAHEIATLEGGPLSDAAFEQAKRQVVETVLFGVTAAK